MVEASDLASVWDALGPLVGVVIGGVLTYAATVKLDDRRIQRDHDREVRDARATARLFANELKETSTTLEACVGARRWIPPFDSYRPDFPHQDRKVLVSHLSDEDSQTLAHALLWLRILDNIATAMEADGNRDFGDGDEERAQAGLTAVTDAAQRLVNFADGGN